MRLPILRVLVIGACFEALVSSQEITLASESVVFGESFELSVIADQGFDQTRLLPLVVELVNEQPVGDLVRWRFRARCYEIGDVTLALDPPFHLNVASCLPTPFDPSSELEWPSEGWMITEPARTHWLVIGLALIAGLVGVSWWRRSQRGQMRPLHQLQRPDNPWDALAALRELTDFEGDEVAFFQSLKAIVRMHCVVCLDLPAEARTSEELVAALPSAVATLGPCLKHCDLAMFGRTTGSFGATDEARSLAREFVKATLPHEASS